MEFLCGYVEGWLYLVNIFLNHPEFVNESNMDHLKEFVLDYAVLKQSWRELYK